jgi:hypothetical protein
MIFGMLNEWEADAAEAAGRSALVAVPERADGILDKRHPLVLQIPLLRRWPFRMAGKIHGADRLRVGRRSRCGSAGAAAESRTQRTH